MKKLITFSLAILFSSLISANETAPMNPDETAIIETSFHAIDADRDGVISMAEVEDKDALLTVFAQLDANQDGDLSVAEFSKFYE